MQARQIRDECSDGSCSTTMLDSYVAWKRKLSEEEVYLTEKLPED
jgi:hypothetical protein